MTDQTEVRPPWTDEMPRLQYFLPAAFLFDPNPFLLVAVAGRVERFVGALALTLRQLDETPSAWLSMRVENENPVGAELLERGLEEAWKRGTGSVHFGQTVDEESAAAEALQRAGFEPGAVHEVYEINSHLMGARLNRIHERLMARKIIPSNVELTTLQPSVVPKVRRFLFENLPSSASALALETASYKAEHSLALMQDGVIKGVLLCRRAANVAHVGLRVVAEELRGGLGWANLLLLHGAISSGLQTGLELTRFEFNPGQHHDTKQFANLNGARLVGRRLLFKVKKPDKRSLTNTRAKG
jgi:hypothetical protein